MAKALRRLALISGLLAAAPAFAAAPPPTAGTATAAGNPAVGSSGSSAPRQLPTLRVPRTDKRNPAQRPCTGLPPGALDCEPLTK